MPYPLIEALEQNNGSLLLTREAVCGQGLKRILRRHQVVGLLCRGRNCRSRRRPLAPLAPLSRSLFLRTKAARLPIPFLPMKAGAFRVTFSSPFRVADFQKLLLLSAVSVRSLAKTVRPRVNDDMHVRCVRVPRVERPSPKVAKLRYRFLPRWFSTLSDMNRIGRPCRREPLWRSPETGQGDMSSAMLEPAHRYARVRSRLCDQTANRRGLPVTF